MGAVMIRCPQTRGNTSGRAWRPTAAPLKRPRYFSPSPTARSAGPSMNGSPRKPGSVSRSHARAMKQLPKANSDQFDAEFVGWAKSPAMFVNGGQYQGVHARLRGLLACAIPGRSRGQVLPTRIERGRALAHPCRDSMSSELAIVQNIPAIRRPPPFSRRRCGQDWLPARRA
jgi:hypothetical protein